MCLKKSRFCRTAVKNVDYICMLVEGYPGASAVYNFISEMHFKKVLSAYLDNQREAWNKYNFFAEVAFIRVWLLLLKC